MPGTVTLIGAGCGPADLITMRGAEYLHNCDAVVYDDLVDPALLDLAPPDAERIYMGKRQGRPSPSQEEINRALVSLAAQGKRVARLKGGDPFVFGRGGEEILALRQAGIPWSSVPGITSAIAIPAAAGIPATHRGLSRSLHILTGSSAGDGSLSLPEADHLAAMEGTLVFLMGLRHLPQIVQRLLDAGKSPNTPAAVISGGTAPTPATVRGPLHKISELAAGVMPPAVIVVGESAGLDLSAPPLPLSGIQVGLTGTSAIQHKLHKLLSASGANPICIQRTLLRALPLHFSVESLADGRRRWVVLTSVNGVHFFFRALAQVGLDLRKLSHCSFAVLGQSTAHALSGYGIYPDLCPSESTSRGLGLSLREIAQPDEEILLFRASNASSALLELLAEKGLSVLNIPLYEPYTDASTPTESNLTSLDFLVFSSAGGVELFFRSFGSIPAGVKCVCIGEVTASALTARNCPAPLLAGQASAEGIVEAILHSRRNS